MNLLRLPSEVQFLAKGLVVIIAVSAGDVSSQISELRGLRREQARARGVAAIGKRGGPQERADIQAGKRD